VEVFESVREWMHGMAASWTSGAMLVVDYGGATEDIYHRRPEGTLRAYRGQQRLTGNEIYELPGRQDITADVNFDDLAIWARELGWEVSEAKQLAKFAPGAPGADAFRCISFARL
jgi:SAM-dependent MidA family methyltransferase